MGVREPPRAKQRLHGHQMCCLGREGAARPWKVPAQTSRVVRGLWRPRWARAGHHGAKRHPRAHPSSRRHRGSRIGLWSGAGQHQSTPARAFHLVRVPWMLQQVCGWWADLERRPLGDCSSHGRHGYTDGVGGVRPASNDARAGNATHVGAVDASLAP